jgi:hypothetical protein
MNSSAYDVDLIKLHFKGIIISKEKEEFEEGQ